MVTADKKISADDPETAGLKIRATGSGLKKKPNRLAEFG